MPRSGPRRKMPVGVLAVTVQDDVMRAWRGKCVNQGARGAKTLSSVIGVLADGLDDGGVKIAALTSEYGRPSTACQAIRRSFSMGAVGEDV